MKVEITGSIDLSDAQQRQLDMHSFHNILGVLSLEIEFLGSLLGARDSMKVCHADAQELSLLVDERGTPLYAIQVLPQRMENLHAAIDAELKKAVVDPKYRDLLEQSYANIENIFRIADVRVREFLARAEAPEAWMWFAADDVKDRLTDILLAIQQNAKGRYGVAFSPEDHTPLDYLFDISICGPNGGVTVPAVLLDSMRDLTANARKYTAPGGSISAKLEETADQVRLTVTDTGRGIPEAELPNVVRFGYRASNVTADETRGKGYGLTKAYYVTHQFGGRMWIESVVNKGTTVTIEIPKPAMRDA